MSVLLVLLLALFPVEAPANNGLNMIGFGSESTGMGGADLAVARDTSAMNTNPAGIAQIPGSRLDANAAYAYQIELAHRDRLGNDTEVSNKHIFFGSGGYSRRIGDGPFHAGIGVFAQGGAGSVYKDLITPFGTRDEFSSLFRIAKATPSLAYRATDRLFLGGSFQVVYTDIRQKIFPHTSFFDAADPLKSFFGVEVKDMDGVGAGVKLGILYRASDRFAVGAAYTTPIELPLKGGKVVINMEAAGLGRVTYRNAEIKGLELPQELGVGISFRPVGPLLLALDISWIDWSSSMKTSTLRATDPDNPLAPPVLVSSSPLNWRDQYVIAFGLACDATEKTILRAGYNYGRNPIPDETLSPLLAAFSEHHVTLGIGYEIDRSWRTDLAIEYVWNGEVSHENPQLPFGPGSQEEGESILFHVMLSRTW